MDNYNSSVGAFTLRARGKVSCKELHFITADKLSREYYERLQCGGSASFLFTPHPLPHPQCLHLSQSSHHSLVTFQPFFFFNHIDDLQYH